jgi:Peptidase family M48
LDQFRKLKQKVVSSSKPEKLERVGETWRALLFAGGRRIRIEPTTKIEFRLSSIEQEDLKRSAKEKDAGGKLHTLSQLEDVAPGQLMTFEGMVAPDGTVTAERVEFRRNEREKREEGLWQLFKAKVKTPREHEKKPSILKFSFSIADLDLRLLPQDIQDYVSKVGNSLVPAYQRALPDAELTRIPFQFYVVERKEAFTVALPVGAVIVSSAMFDVLENEAQLASLLGREIAHVVQKHHMRQAEESTQKRFALALGKLGSFSRLNEVQADRLSLEYMLLAGYDVREAPRAWKLIAGKHPERDYAVTRQSSLIVALQDTYSQPDPKGTRKNEEEFRQAAARLREAMDESQARKKK